MAASTFTNRKMIFPAAGWTSCCSRKKSPRQKQLARTKKTHKKTLAAASVNDWNCDRLERLPPA